MSLPKGYGTPFIEVYTWQGVITERIEEFRYSFNQEEPDTCTIQIRTKDYSIADRPSLSFGSQLRVKWGYRQGSSSILYKVYVVDYDEQYDMDELIITLKCKDRGFLLAHGIVDDVSNGKNVNDLAKEECEKRGIEWVGSFKAVMIGDDRFAMGPGFIKEAEYLPQLVDEIPMLNSNPWSIFLYQYMREPHGPTDIETRNDKASAKQKNFDQVPIRTYHWKGGDGELLRVNFSVDNSSNIDTASATIQSGWDDEKEVVQKGVVTKDNEKEVDNRSLTTLATTNPLIGRKDRATLLQEAKLHGGLWEKVELKREGKESIFVMSLYPESTLVPITELDFGSILDTRGTPPSNPIKITEDFEANVREGTVVENTGHRKFIIFPEFSTHIPSSKMGPEEMNEAANEQRKAVLKGQKVFGSCIGDPSVESGKLLGIWDVSKRHSGNVFLNTVTHVISKSGGYTYDFSGFKDGEQKSEKDISEIEESKEVGDEKDKDNRNKIEVKTIREHGGGFQELSRRTEEVKQVDEEDQQ